MKKTNKWIRSTGPLLFLLLSLGLPFLAQADGKIYIKMGEARAKKSMLAFPPLQFSGTPANAPNFQSVGADLFRVISNDLSISTYFQFMNASAFLEDAAKTGLHPQPADPNGFKFDSWRQIGAEFLIRAAFSIENDQVTLETYTYHVPDGELVLGKKYRGTKGAIRRIAHSFCNDLLEAMTGKAGMYLSRLVAASDRNGGEFREIYLMDWDGHNMEKITSHHSICMSPTWSNDGSKVAYTAYVQSTRSKLRNADLFLYDVENEKRTLLSYRIGMNSGAAFFPNNNNLLMTLSKNENPDIYKINLEGEIISKLTNGPGESMNVEPAISPDGKKVAFSSDRSGKQPMIYTMNVDGSDVKRLTFVGKYNATPAWSPDGTKIAFGGWSEDHFDIFTMNADGSDILRLTSARKKNGKAATNEDPCFSPDGRHLVYTSDRTGTNQIFISNLDGSEERRITADSANYYKPKWSKNQE